MTDLSIPPVDSALLAQARHLLLEPTALDDAMLSRVLASIHTHAVDFADLYFQYSRMEGWSLEEGIVKSGSFHIDRGVGVRAVHGDKQAFAYSDDITLAALEEAAVAVRAIGRQGGPGGAALAKVGPARMLYAPLDPVAKEVNAGTIISASTFREIEGKFRTIPAPPIVLRGRQEPTVSYQVVV